MDSKSLVTRINGLRAAAKYISRDAGKAARTQVEAYLKALDDVESIVNLDEGVLVYGSGASRTLFTSDQIDEAREDAQKGRDL